MRSHELPLEQYDTDKVANGYLARYDAHFAPWLDRPVQLLELGVRTGGSVQLWRDYFVHGTVTGIDIRLPAGLRAGERIHLFEGSQGDTAFLSRVAQQVAPGGFDIVIDDASHLGELTKTAFWHLFDNHLKPGGLYVIEDWGTGYWEDWPDGAALDLDAYAAPAGPRHPLLKKLAAKLGLKFPMRGHAHGLPGFIKQLVDEQAAHDVSKRRSDGASTRGPKFSSVTITPSVVFVQKAG